MKAFAFKLSLFILLVHFACNNEKHNDKKAVAATQHNAKDSVQQEARHLVQLLLERKIEYQVYDTLSLEALKKLKSRPGGNTNAVAFLEAIFSMEPMAAKDTLLHKAVANAYYQYGELLNASVTTNDSLIICLEKAIGLHKKIASLKPIDEKFAYQLLGLSYNKCGDPHKSLRYYNMQLSLVDPKKFDAVARVVVNKAIAFMDTGQADSAIFSISQVLDKPDIKPLRRADLFTVLADAQIRNGLLHFARQSIANAFLILDTLPGGANDVNEKKAMALKQKGVLERLEGKAAISVSTLETALVTYMKTGTTHGRDIAKILIEKGRAFESNNQADSALISYHAALLNVVPGENDVLSLPVTNLLYAENAIMEALDGKAGIFLQKNRIKPDARALRSAVACFERSFLVERKLLETHTYDESKMLMLMESRRRSERAIHSCYELFRQTGEQQWAEKGFMFAEKSKAFVLLESVRKNIAANTVLQNDTLFERIKYLQVQLSYLERLMYEARIAGNDSLLVRLKEQQQQWDKQLLLAGNELVRSNEAYRGIVSKEDSLTAALAAKKLLSPGIALAEFFTGDSTNYIFCLQKGKPVIFNMLPGRTVEEVQSFLRFFSSRDKINNDPAGYSRSAFELFNLCGISGITTDNTRTLLIIPDGIFNYVPFDALLTSSPATTELRLYPYLVSKFNMVYGYSAATLIKQAEQPAAGPRGVSAFSPVFSNNERGLLPLPHSRKELDDIQRAAPQGTYYRESSATLPRLRTAVTNSGVIHIASHARAGLSPAIEMYDSTLYLKEIYTMPIRAKLVVLSACESGLGEENQSEGMMSLARGFYYAGAQNIITSLWNADDKSTSLLFSAFYQQAGNDYARMLNEAKRQYLQNASTGSASPYFWAGFIHIGYQPPSSQKQFPWWTIALLIPAVMVVIYFRRRK